VAKAFLEDARKISQVMSHPRVTVPSVASVADVAKQMDHSGVGCVLVVEDERLAGVVTDRDPVQRASCIATQTWLCCR
jgi:CBS domain-containing protein